MDYLESLPTDNTPIRPSDEKIIRNILIKDESPFYRIIMDFKDPIVSGLLFMLFNTPQINEFIQSAVPYARSSETSLLVFKTIIFVVLLFVIKNVNLSLKS